MQAIRAARSTRIGSSVKERLEEARRAADSRSPRPPVGSSGVPPSSGTAIELTVKSRSRRSRSIESPRNAATSSFQLPSRAITRQVSNSSESSNGWPSDSSAIRRAAAATSPSKARSTSVTSLPSAASRTAPPTIQARSETSRRPERATSTAGASPKTSSIRVRYVGVPIGRVIDPRSRPVGPRHPRRDRAGDLVVDRRQRHRQLLGGDLVAALRPDQDHGITGLDGRLRA